MSVGVDLAINIIASILYAGGEGGIRFLWEKLRGTSFQQLVDAALKDVAKEYKLPDKQLRWVILGTFSKREDIRSELRAYVEGESEISLKNLIVEYAQTHELRQSPDQDIEAIVARFLKLLRRKIAAQAEPEERQILADLSKLLGRTERIEDVLLREQLAAAGLLKIALVRLAKEEGWNRLTEGRRKQFLHTLIQDAGIEPKPTYITLCEKILQSNHLQHAGIAYREVAKTDPSVRQMIDPIVSKSNMPSLVQVISESSEQSSHFSDSLYASLESHSNDFEKFLDSLPDQEIDLTDRIILGKYRLDYPPIGEGTFGRVYQGHSVETALLKDEVAIKELKRKHLTNPTAVKRFVKEAEIAHKIRHPHVVYVYELGQESDSFYIVMELLKGGNLRELLKRREKFSITETLQILIAVCEGIEALHNQNIIHRDLKPANILFTQERQAKITDFGLARVVDLSLDTQIGHPIGTIPYMAPEQISGNSSIDKRADIYAAGVIGYEMLTGKFYLDFQDTNNLTGLTQETF